MLKTLDGETRLFAILGDPIAQVNPRWDHPGDGGARRQRHRGADARAPPGDYAAFMRAAPGIQNLEGLIMTVPHKIPVAAYVETFTERAKFLGACNILRRIAPGGGWHADATDGYGCVTAMTSKGVSPAGSARC